MGLESLVSNGVGMVVLQGTRAFSIIALTTAIVACWVLIVKINTDRTFFFFDAASLLFTSTVSLFLTISELPFVRGYFNEIWPVLGDGHGLTWFGLANVIIGCNLLGKLNLPANDASKIGLPWWRLVLAGGILTIVMGILNIIFSFIWGDNKSGITARDVRANGSLANADQQLPYTKTFHSKQSTHSSLRNEKTKSKFMSMFWKKDEEESHNVRPNISGPITTHHPNNDIEHQGDSYAHTSPVAPGIQRPDSALHPLRREHSSRSSKYSAAHMSRF
ncbi:hypothetical protein CC79DRAFT_1336256 [Sarocladium strictum]